LLLLVLPGGLGEALQRVRDRLLRWVAARHSLMIPTLVADRLEDPSSPDESLAAPREDALLAGALSSGERALSSGEGLVAEAPEVTGELVAVDYPGAAPVEDPWPEEGQEGPPPLLRCRQVEISYGPVQILFGADLEVAEGEIVALLGTNGAGK